MKNYRQLVKELPSKKVVFAFGRFQPPTTGHELLVNAVKKLAGIGIVIGCQAIPIDQPVGE